MAERKHYSKRRRADDHQRMQDLYRTWARNRWPGAAPDAPDWSDVETAFQAGFYLCLTEHVPGVPGTPAPWTPGPLESVKNCLDNSLKRAVQALRATGHEGDAIDATRLEYLRELVKLGVPPGVGGRDA